MYQVLCGDVYLYLDSILTWDEKEVRKDASSIISIINCFFKMLEVWFSVIPSKGDYAPFMKKYPNLYLVCPDAAILNLYKSFETTLSLIFSYSPRSEDFMKVSSYNLDLGNIKCESKVKRMHQVRTPPLII